jgi:hypothetical protein
MSAVITPPAPSGPPPAGPPAVVLPQLYRLSVEQFHRMVDADVFPPDVRVELLEGYLVEKMTRKPHHDSTIDLLNFELFRRLPSGWFLRMQEAVTLTDSEPEPDVSLVRGGPRTYSDHHPYAPEIGLLIEVSEPTLPQDREKVRIYAANNVVCYWIVNLVDYQAEVFTGPSGPTNTPGYAAQQTYGQNDSIPLVLDGQQVATVPVKDLLP